MTRTSRPIVALGERHQRIEARAKLDREEAAIDDWLKARVDEAFADRRPNVPARDVFKRLRKRHARGSK